MAEENFDTKKAIKDLVDTSWSGSNEEQGRASSLFKGLSFSDDPEANKFMKYMDDCASKYKMSESKKESKKVVKENYTVIDIASNIIKD